VSENRGLERLFVPKSKYVAGGWIKFRNEEFYNFNSSQNTIIVIKLKRMRLVKIYHA
jgi:hypothetical protein